MAVGASVSEFSTREYRCVNVMNNEPLQQATGVAHSSASGKVSSPSLTHYSTYIKKAKSPIIDGICSSFVEEISFQFWKLKTVTKNGAVGFIVLQSDGSVLDCLTESSLGEQAPYKPLVFICVNDTNRGTGWAHEFNNRWVIKLNFSYPFPHETVGQLVRGWVTAGCYLKIYDGLSAGELHQLAKYYEEIDQITPFRETFLAAMREQVTLCITSSLNLPRGHAHK